MFVKHIGLKTILRAEPFPYSSNKEETSEFETSIMKYYRKQCSERLRPRHHLTTRHCLAVMS